MRILIMLLGAGVGVAASALLAPYLQARAPQFMQRAYAQPMVYIALGLLGAIAFFILSGAIIRRTMQLVAAIEKRWDAMPTQQIIFTSLGLIVGLVVAALLTQLIFAAGSSLIAVSFSAIAYLLLGYVGMQVGYRRYHDGKTVSRRARHKSDKAGDTIVDALLGEDEPDEPQQTSRKLLDTSVIIDGRILDVMRTGFLEGELVLPQFVLAELRHIADSGDSLRRARGRRGLDVLGKLQKEFKQSLIVDETDYPDLTEVDVKLLRLCRDKGGAVLTNDYNLNKVAGVTGIRVLNINDLANAVKPMLMAGEELTVQVTREGKEPGQGVAYLDDGTMIVVENGRRYVGENVGVIVTTVLQTSAGRMIFTKLKASDEKAG